MASLLHKLLKKPPPPPPPTLRILSAFNNNPQLPPNSPLLRQNPIYKAAPNPPPLYPSDREREMAIPCFSFHNPLLIYPSFPHGYHLDPVGPDRSGADWVDEAGSGRDGGDRAVWADSVKKKRKRKMNKHKYNKLRKMLRRKT